jgi:hypothetical protein
MKAAILACVLAAMTSTGLGAQGRNLDFELLNRTRYVVTHIFVAPSSSDDWGEDIMGKDVLGAGESVEIEFSRSERDCRWDLKIIDEDEDEIEWTGLNLCTASHITLLYENGVPTAIVK